VTLVGHSLGAYVGVLLALSTNAFASSCRASGDGVPTTFVGISGPYHIDQPGIAKDIAAVLGGTRAQAPYAWRQGDPFAWVGRRQGVRIRLVHGASDPEVEVSASEDLASALVRAGYDSTLTVVAGATHVSVLGSTRDGEWTEAVILSALR
jgi:pimeloyl-ACP methyl ester carboxylesterase